MLQYLIIAYDGTDTNAADRRMKVRPSHFDNARDLRRQNQFVTGGAILDDQGRMIGSMMVMQFETEDDLLHWMRHEPYITGDVWQNIEVKPFRLADV